MLWPKNIYSYGIWLWICSMLCFFTWQDSWSFYSVKQKNDWKVFDVTFQEAFRKNLLKSSVLCILHLQSMMRVGEGGNRFRTSESKVGVGYVSKITSLVLPEITWFGCPWSRAQIFEISWLDRADVPWHAWVACLSRQVLNTLTRVTRQRHLLHPSRREAQQALMLSGVGPIPTCNHC